MLTISRWRGWAVPAAALAVAAALLAGIAVGLAISHRLGPGGRAPAAPSPGGLAAVGFSCRLPVAAAVVGAGGFVDFPSARFAPDPRSQVAYAGGRWLPAGDVPSPDGRSYASAAFSVAGGSPSSTIAVTGAAGRRTVWSGSGYASLVAYRPEGLYFTKVGAQPGSLPGLWTVGLEGGPARPVGASGVPLEEGWWRVDGGAAWGLSAAVPGVAQTLTRLDLATGAAAVWLRQPGASVSVLGFDADAHPVVEIATGGAAPALAEIAVLTSPEKGTRIYTRGAGPRMPVPLDAVSDRHGLWLGAVDGSVWLYTRKEGLRKVAELPAGAAGASFVRVAGPCA